MIKNIPFSIFPIHVLKRHSRRFIGLAKPIEKILPAVSTALKQIRSEYEASQYIAMCIYASAIFFLFIFSVLLLFFGLLKVKSFFLVSLAISLILLLFVFLQQINYPSLLKGRRIKSLDGNLLYALRNILVQVSAGVPLFNVFMIIANGNYGEISREFAIAVKEISSGKPQSDAIKDLTTNNPSIYFRRAMWQLANGLKAGSNVANVLEEIIKTTSEEQIVQISTYGSQLNPIAMFYMLLTVIIPSLSVTFLIVLSALLSLSEGFTKMAFWGLFMLVLFAQIMFLGLIKSKRPTLMGE